MTNLSDTQAVLLASSAQRPTGSVFLLPTSLQPGGGAVKAIGVLVSRGLVEERETDDPAAMRRTDGDERIGLFLTAAGAAAIGVDLPGSEPMVANGAGDPEAPAAVRGKAPPKPALVLDLRRRPAGATLAELIALTGWLPHTMRAALTGLRKKGHPVERGARDGVSVYRVAGE